MTGAFQMDALRHEIDTLTPECREIFPEDPTFFATMMVSSMIVGAANLLRTDTIAWSELAVDRDRRHQIAAETAAMADRLLDES